MKGLLDLYRLQQLLLEKNRLSRRLKEMQGDSSLEKNQEKIETLDIQFKGVQEQLKLLQNTLKKKEDLADKIHQQKEEYEKKLYDGQITNAKELEQLQIKIFQMQKEEANLEEDILKLMFEVDEHRERSDEFALRVKDKRENFLSQKNQHEKMLGQYQTEILNMEEKVSELSQTINKALYDRFTRLAEQKGGLGIVEIREGVCGGCQVALSAYILEKVLRGEGIVVCENCGRILYSSKDGY